jgi:hypothetical protein
MRRARSTGHGHDPELDLDLVDEDVSGLPFAFTDAEVVTLDWQQSFEYTILALLL